MQEHLSSPSLANADAVAQRMVQCSHNRDGLPEILAGLIFLIASGMCWPDVLFRGRPQQLLGLVFTAFVCLMCALSGWIIRSVRERYLLPWVGYVQLRPYPRSRKVVAFIVALTTAIAFVFLVRKVEMRDLKSWLLPIDGIFVGGFQFIVGRLPRFWTTGTLAICAGVLLTFIDWPFELCLALFFLFVGMVELTAGGMTLLCLLHQRDEIGA